MASLLQRLSDSEIKLLLEENEVTHTFPFDRDKALQLLSGECGDCYTPSKLTIVYRKSKKNISVVTNKETNCVPCQKMKNIRG